MPLQYTLDSFEQTLEHRHLLYCEQQPSTDELSSLPSSPLIPVLEQFLIAYPQWQTCVSIANVVTSEQQQQPSLVDACSVIENAVPVYLEKKSNPSLIAMADICLLMLKPDNQQKWLKDVYHGGTNSTATQTTRRCPKYVILIDPSTPLLPPSPPLLPADQYKIITLQRIDQLPSTLNSILSNLGDEVDPKEIIPSSSQPLQVDQVFKAYQDAKKQRLFLFDYDGTLTPIVSRPEMALPTPTLLAYLSTLCTDPLNAVWIISGRDQKFLHDCFGHLHGLGLSAEHGSFMKMPGESVWMDMLKDAVLPWKPQAMAIFTSFTNDLPGTEIEQKKSSITWHYRNAHDQAAASRQSHECHQALLGLPGVDILVGKMNLEVRSVLVNKGNVVKRIRRTAPADFVICAGDDQTDEDMFRVLFHDTMAYTILVGPSTKQTLAKSCVETSHDVVHLLGRLAGSTKTTNKERSAL